MALVEHIQWYLDANTYGGVLSERLLAALTTARDGTLWCGLIFTFSTAGRPCIEFWERIDDMERSGFLPISTMKARAIFPDLHRFLEELERLERERVERDTSVGG